jgi:hypothetical protein
VVPYVREGKNGSYLSWGIKCLEKYSAWDMTHVATLEDLIFCVRFSSEPEVPLFYTASRRNLIHKQKDLKKTSVSLSPQANYID